MEQRSETWFQARLGKVTASRIGDVMAKTKSGYGASRANYMAQLVVERMTGKAPEMFTNAAMQWGTDTEPLARAAYEAHNNVMVDETGLVDHPSIPMSGASPDGLIGEHGMLEIKCPNTATHIETVLTGKIDEKYVYQMQWQMACTGRQWCDFVSFDPRMDEGLQLKIIPVKRDDKLISDIEVEVKCFLYELDQKVKSLNALKGQK